LETDGAVPETDGAVPETDGAVPETDGAVPETDGTVPETKSAFGLVCLTKTINKATRLARNIEIIKNY